MHKKNSHNRYQCPCCNYYTLIDGDENSYDICNVCYWENDGLQFENPDMEGGANDVSLNQARNNFKEFNASEKCFLLYVNKPSSYEIEP